MARHIRIATIPFTPSTSRITSGWFSRIGMQSVILDRAGRCLELGLENESVRPGTSARCVTTGSLGCDLPVAVLLVSEQAAKQACESNRGRHSQSIEPFSPTSAAVWVSPINP